jgi:acyl-CoA thioester hydrolase
MHSFPVTVFYEDTDLGGIVYHANYLKYIERGRSAWIRALGIDQNALRDTHGLVFAVHRIEADFRAPARLDDALVVHTRLAETRSGVRFVLAQEVADSDGRAIFAATVTLVTMQVAGEGAGRPARLPAELRRLLPAPGA